MSYFTLSKVFWWFFDPAIITLIALVFGCILLMTKYWRTGRLIVCGMIVFSLMVAIVPIGSWGLQKLENRFPPTDLPLEIDGIIVLGGAIDPLLSEKRQSIHINGSAERLFTFLSLRRQYPDTKMIYTGGSGRLGEQASKEADIARDLFADLGIDMSGMIFENRSRNTFENAIFSETVAGDITAQRWVLVTSASHMPRAIGTFRKAGWSVIAFPVDYKTDPDTKRQWSANIITKWVLLRQAMHEWVGLLAYAVLGYTDTLFPGPELSSK